MTNREMISNLRSLNKFISDDDEISDRFLYNLLKDNLSILLKRELDLRRLTSSDNVYQRLKNIELIKTDAAECGLEQQTLVRRSKYKLPTIEEGKFSYFIQGVFNISENEEISPVSIKDYINYSKLRVKSKKKFYTFKDSYLYIFDPDIEEVNIYAYFRDSIEDHDYKKGVSMYEKEFKIPNYMIPSVLKLCNENLLFYHKIPVEQEDNNKDENQ